MFFPISETKADFFNPSFETGDLTGWEHYGNASTQTQGSFGVVPLSGTHHALILSHEPGAPSFPITGLETFLNLAPGGLNGISTGEVVGGAAIRQSFTASAGDKVRFGWAFLTNNDPEALDFNSFAFAVVSPASNAVVLGDTFSSLKSSDSALFSLDTGYSNFEYVLPATGEFILAIGVVDVGDDFVTSGVLVDNVALISSVPEPSSLIYLGAACLVGLTMVIFSRHQRHT